MQCAVRCIFQIKHIKTVFSPGAAFSCACSDCSAAASHLLPLPPQKPVPLNFGSKGHFAGGHFDSRPACPSIGDRRSILDTRYEGRGSDKKAGIGGQLLTSGNGNSSSRESGARGISSLRFSVCSRAPVLPPWRPNKAQFQLNLASRV